MLCRALCGLLFLAFTAEAANDTVVYCRLWRSPFEVFAPLFASIPGISLFPWQLLLLVLTPLCLLRPGAFRQRSAVMDAAILASFASIVLTFLWGMMRGGSAYNAYYQLWRFLVALLVGVLLLSVVRRPRDLRAVGLTILLAAVVRGGLAIYFYWAHVHGKTIDPPPTYMTTHDDTLLFIAGLFYDTSTLRHNAWSEHQDLTTQRGREWFHATVRDFFSLIPPRHWAMIDDKPIMLLYSASFAKAHDQSVRAGRGTS